MLMVHGFRELNRVFKLTLQILKLTFTALVAREQEFLNSPTHIFKISSITKQSALLQVMSQLTGVILMILSPNTILHLLKSLPHLNLLKFLSIILLLTQHYNQLNVHQLPQLPQQHQMQLTHSKHGLISKNQRTILISLTLLVHQKLSGFNNSTQQLKLVCL